MQYTSADGGAGKGGEQRNNGDEAQRESESGAYISPHVIVTQ
jgi:hypothetical protein